MTTDLTDDQLIQHEIARTEAAWARRGETMSPEWRAAFRTHLSRPESLAMLRKSFDSADHSAPTLVQKFLNKEAIE